MLRFSRCVLVPRKLGSKRVVAKAVAATTSIHEKQASAASTRQQRGTSSAAKSSASAATSSSSKPHKNAGKLGFDASKAGLQKVDREHVEKVIQEASRGTPFYKKEQRREEMRREKVEAMLKKAEGYEQLSSALRQVLRGKVDVVVHELEATRDLRRRYIHVDMDMFYAAVEEKKNPSLHDVPFGVGANSMLCTTNYIARQYGVRSGMPGFIGKKLCPDLLIVPVDFKSYQREAAVVHSIAARFDPQFVSLGLDELTMDITSYLEQYPCYTPSQVASEFREEVYARTQLTCSGGIAPTSGFAKIASNVNKPNGQHEIVLLSRDDTIAFVSRIPLRQIPGIGYAQELTLNALGIYTCGDLFKKRYLLCYLFKEKTFRHYMEASLGLMETFSRKQHEQRQSIGKEMSFSDPLESPEALVKLFRKMLEQCHARCVREQLWAGQMRLVLKYHTYDTEQFSITLPRPTNDLKVWLEASRALLKPHLERYAEYRLVGVRMQKLMPVGSSITSRDEQYDAEDEEQDDESDFVFVSAAGRRAVDTSQSYDVEEEEEEEVRVVPKRVPPPPPPARKPAAASGKIKKAAKKSSGRRR